MGVVSDTKIIQRVDIFTFILFIHTSVYGNQQHECACLTTTLYIKKAKTFYAQQKCDLHFMESTQWKKCLDISCNQLAHISILNGGEIQEQYFLQLHGSYMVRTILMQRQILICTNNIKISLGLPQTFIMQRQVY